MPIKLFKKGPVPLTRGEDLNLSQLESEMNIFMLPIGMEIVQVNGPYASYLPSERKDGPERVIYTANIVYNNKR
jgi:hypothetical protein